MAFEMYRVAVELTMLDLLSPKLLAVNERLAASDAAAGRLGKSMGGMGTVLAGVGIAAGIGISLIGKKLIDAAAEMQVAEAKFKELNFGDAINEQAHKMVLGVNTVGTSKAQLTSILAETVGLFPGRLDEAMKFVPLMANMAVANAAIYGKGQKGVNAEDLRSLVKFVDMWKQSKTEAGFEVNFKEGLDVAQKMISGTGGFLTPSMLKTFAKNASMALGGLSNEGMMKLSMGMEEMGPGIGVGLASMYQNLIAGRTPKKAMVLLEKFGLGKIDEITAGSYKGKPIKTTKFEPTPEFARELAADPIEAIHKWIHPLAQKANMELVDEIKLVNDLLSNRKGAQIAIKGATQYYQMLRDFEVVKGAMTVEESVKFAQTLYPVAMADFEAKWQDFKMILGMKFLPQVTAAIQWLTQKLQAATNYFNQGGTWKDLATKDFGKNVVTSFSQIGHDISPALDGFFHNIKTSFEQIGHDISPAMDGFVHNITSTWNRMNSELEKTWSVMGADLARATRGFCANLVASFVRLGMDSKSAVTGMIGNLVASVRKLWSDVETVTRASLVRFGADMKSVVAGLCSNLVSSFGKLGSDLESVTSGFCATIVASFVQLGEEMKSAVAGMGGNLVNSFGKLGSDLGGIAHRLGGAFQKETYHVPGGAARPGPHAAPVQVHTTVNMDGRAIARQVSYHQGRDASHPPAGGRFHDPTLALVPVPV